MSRSDKNIPFHVAYKRVTGRDYYADHNNYTKHTDSVADITKILDTQRVIIPHFYIPDVNYFHYGNMLPNYLSYTQLVFELNNSTALMIDSSAGFTPVAQKVFTVINDKPVVKSDMCHQSGTRIVKYDWWNRDINVKTPIVETNNKYNSWNSDIVDHLLQTAVPQSHTTGEYNIPALREHQYECHSVPHMEQVDKTTTMFYSMHYVTEDITNIDDGFCSSTRTNHHLIGTVYDWGVPTPESTIDYKVYTRDETQDSASPEEWIEITKLSFGNPWSSKHAKWTHKLTHKVRRHDDKHDLHKLAQEYNSGYDLYDSDYMPHVLRDADWDLY